MVVMKHELEPRVKAVFGDDQAIRPPAARLIDISVCRTRRMVPARSIA